VELSPRTAPEAPGAVTPKRRRSPWAYGALVLVLLGIGVVAYQALSSASLYYYNADEAVEEREELGDRRFQVQGLVRDDLETTADGVTFTITFNGVDVPVRHQGDPPELFKPGIPVVLEGRWASDGEVFESDRILVKHTPEYEAENGDRIDDAEDAESGDSTTP
jgi:cytochrome c-type biogenesis protein CcmE